MTRVGLRKRVCSSDLRWLALVGLAFLAAPGWARADLIFGTGGSTPVSWQNVIGKGGGVGSLTIDCDPMDILCQQGARDVTPGLTGIIPDGTPLLFTLT